MVPPFKPQFWKASEAILVASEPPVQPGVDSLIPERLAQFLKQMLPMEPSVVPVLNSMVVRFTQSVKVVVIGPLGKLVTSTRLAQPVK
jgi:hypothetical protein